ncbi:hypothetical protein GVN18_42145 [Pseudomonas sp. ODNR1LW]|nr:hypothetical protein [Pseudomonas sp. ODNR1LW]
MTTSTNYWPKSWDDVAVPETEAEAKTITIACRQRLVVMEDCLRRRALGSKRKAARLVRRFLHSDSAKIAMMEGALAKKGRRGVSNRTLIQMATAIRADQFSGEPVWKSLVERADGKFRMTYSFGPIEYARQKLAHQALKIFTPIAASQFMHSGGVPAAAHWLSLNVRSKTWVTTTDIPDCFLRQSRLPFESGGFLPKSVMTSVLFEPMLVAKQRKPMVLGGELVSSLQQEFYSDAGPAPERGIPPGSAPSSLLVDMRLGELARSAELASEGVMVGNYLDDFIILAPTKKAADVTFEALYQSILAEYGADAAEQVRHRRKTSTGKDGFVFLGDNYVRQKRRLVRTIHAGKADAYAARLAQKIQLENLSPERIEASLLGWTMHHSYDPSTKGLAEEFRDDFMPKGEIMPDEKGHNTGVKRSIFPFRTFLTAIQGHVIEAFARGRRLVP